MDPLKSSAQLEKLKCTLCKNSLSYFPIKISCENRQNICGRCTIPEETLSKYIHNEVYETAAYFLRFPCRYENEGCAKSMSPEEVPKHEKSCPFQVVTCPVKKSTNCDWKSSLPKLLQHCQNQHLDLFLKNGEFEMDISEAHDFENFVEHEDILLLTMRKFSSTNNMFLFSVSYFAADVKNLCYHVSFKNKNKGVHLDGNASAFSEGLKDINEITLDALKNHTNENDQSTIFVTITLNRGDEHEQISSVQKQNENMLSQLKCSDCSDYVLPPICYSDGQLYCSDCKVKIVIENETRNLALDKLASLLDYPCRYWKSGCSVVSKADQMENHQKFCLKGSYPCPVNEYLNCEWTGLGEDFLVHLSQEHSNIIITNSSEIEINTNFTTQKTTQSISKLCVDRLDRIDRLFERASFKHATEPREGLSFGKSASFCVSGTAKPFPKTKRRNIFPRNTDDVGKSFITFSEPQPPQQSFSFNSNLENSHIGALPDSQPIRFGQYTTTIDKKSITSNTNSTGGEEEFSFEKCYIILFLNHLFRLSFAIKGKTYCWVVQTTGNFDGKFKYELEIVDKTGQDRKLLAKQTCSPLTKKDDVFKKKEHCCFFPAEDMTYFLSPQKDLTFKVRIVK